MLYFFPFLHSKYDILPFKYHYTAFTYHAASNKYHVLLLRKASITLKRLIFGLFYKVRAPPSSFSMTKCDALAWIYSILNPCNDICLTPRDICLTLHDICLTPHDI